jgi:uncharacterized membrane protein
MSEERFIELDIFRGVAIFSMILLHLIWDLDYYDMMPLNNALYQLNKLVSFTFFILAGIVLSLSYRKKPFTSIIKHGLWVFNTGMMLTIISLVAIPDRPIYFGVLHCIGLSIIIGALLLKYARDVFWTAVTTITIGSILNSWFINTLSLPLLIIGLQPAEIWKYTIDYFPIFPWVGIMLIGICLGNVLYKDGKRRFNIPAVLSASIPLRFVSFIGKNSLYVYLAHQPVLVALIQLIKTGVIVLPSYLRF